MKNKGVFGKNHTHSHPPCSQAALYVQFLYIASSCNPRGTECPKVQTFRRTQRFEERGVYWVFVTDEWPGDRIGEQISGLHGAAEKQDEQSLGFKDVGDGLVALILSFERAFTLTLTVANKLSTNLKCFASCNRNS